MAVMVVSCLPAVVFTIVELVTLGSCAAVVIVVMSSFVAAVVAVRRCSCPRLGYRDISIRSSV
ncbi:hypothetical protein M3J09_013332 [Ascochyta lentis]